MTAAIDQSLATIRARAPGFMPRLGVVLGSGLGSFADDIKPVAVIPYGDLPGFPTPGIGGHAGRLVLGHLAGTPIAALQGRAHYYEHGRADTMKVAVRSLAQLGCKTLLLTNAAGSLRPDMAPGSLMLIADHINFAGVSPLFGETGDERFVDMVDAYDPALGRRFRDAAKIAGQTLHEGVYIWFAGPNFETPAEIRAAARLGADAVGMSTVPEVILARHAGMKVAALSVIVNFAAGMSTAALSHQQTMESARQAADSVSRLLTGFVADYGTQDGEAA
ncbi:MAG: purine-nucleoside phosphorylase [Rhodospirillales bacterium]|nr:purine-nucleoside phosphorylase [Rhodospirillales bacterium]